MNVNSCLMRLAVGALVAFTATSCEKLGVQASGEKTSGLTPEKILSIDDENFLLAAQKAEIRQMTLSQAALDTSKNEEIRNYAHQVVTNYRKALTDLGD